MTSAAIRGVLFDKDGTLLDFDATFGPATAAVLGELSGGDAACFADLARLCGFLPDTLGFAPGSPIIGGHTDDFAPALAARLGRPYGAAVAACVNGLYRAASLRSLLAYDDVGPALDRLEAAGLAVGLATNDAEETARAHLARLGIEHRFVFVAGYDSGFGAKPAPGMVRAFAEALGAGPASIVMVGDSPHDIEAARQAGSLALGIVRTDAARRALAGLDVPLIPDLAGLPGALGLLP